MGRIQVEENLQYATKKVVIKSGESLSDVLDIKGYKLISIEMPIDWDLADLTFQASSDGIYFKDVYNDSGEEVTVTADGNRIINIDNNAGALASLRFIKLRSGTAAVPVAQTADREIKIILKG